MVSAEALIRDMLHTMERTDSRTSFFVFMRPVDTSKGRVNIITNYERQITRCWIIFLCLLFLS